MTANTTLRRYLYLIRFTQKPFRYPSIEDIIAGLPEKIVGKRTIERDFATIRNEYGISIKHEPYKKGYYLDIPLDEDIRDFENFVELLERQERMDFLNKTITNVHEAGQYLQLEQHSKFVGTNNLPIL